MTPVELYASLPPKMFASRPELLLVERQISMDPIERWRERVAEDGINVYVKPEHDVLEFAELWQVSGNTIDAAIVDLDRPWGFPDVDPRTLLLGLRELWPGLPLTFFSVDRNWQLPILALPKPRLLYQRDPRESVPEFLEALRPYLLRDPPDPNPIAPPP
jgi:hypothetical protein